MKSVLLIALYLLGSVVPLSASIEAWKPEWEAFRNAYPYHIQVIAISKPNAQGNRLLIISEPPPTLTRSEVAGLAPNWFEEIAFPTNKIGVDGWVRDAAIELKPLSERELATLVDSLHQRLFGTTYKAIAVGIPSFSGIRRPDYNFDLHVPAGKLKRWLLPDLSTRTNAFLYAFAAIILGLYGMRLFRSKVGHKLLHAAGLMAAVASAYYSYKDLSAYFKAAGDAVYFRSALSNEAARGDVLLNAEAQGVFYSKTPGLVMWVVRKDSPVNRAAIDFRRFAVDSDIILGAVANEKTVAIVARERLAPIEVLPPLRTETMLQLAGVSDSELAQSYERTHVFAGKFDGKSDWAPIYLSDNLIDTEYGSLLNITDQLLKSWSLGNYVDYYNFHYPKPDHFPFPKPLNIYANTNEVTFNWNTKGAGYSSQFGAFNAFAWTRTGALPVDYLGNRDARLHEAEDTGYEYFATRNDPNLVRVVQYAELYQIFKQYKITAVIPEVAYHPPVPKVFRTQGRILLNTIARLPDAQLKKYLPADQASEVMGCKEKLRTLDTDTVVEALAAPRVFYKKNEQNGSAEVDSKESRALEFTHECSGVLKEFRDLQSMSLAQIASQYMASLDRPDKSWIHTPSIVISTTQGELVGATGGHNLDSAATILRASPELTAGEVKVVEEEGRRVLEYSAEDSDRIQQSVRTVAREEDKSAANLELKAREALQDAKADMRSIPESLNWSAQLRPSAERGFQTNHAPSLEQKAGWWTGSENPSGRQSEVLNAMNSTLRHTIMIAKNGTDGYMILDGPQHLIVHASTKPGTVDAVFAFVRNEAVPAKQVHLHFRGFDPEEADGFVKTARLQSEGGRDSVQLSATVEEAEYEPSTLKALMQEKYKFKEIDIKSVSKPFLTAEGREAVDVHAAVLSAAEPKPLMVRIRITLRAGVQMTNELLSAIREALANLFRSSVMISDDPSLSLAAFQRAIEKVNPNIHSVQIKLTKEGKDLYIVVNRQPNETGLFAG